MGGKKGILAIVLLAILAVGGLVGYGVANGRAAAQTFSSAGYILVSDGDSADKCVLFDAGTVWKSGVAGTVTFDDLQGNRISVPDGSFVHYDDRSVSALTSGVIVDLDNISTARITNHYAVPAQVQLAWNGSNFTLGSSASAIPLSSCLWKLSSEKYLLESQDIVVDFGDGDVREAGTYIEVTYIDNSVIQIQTEDNLWQTVSDSCCAQLDNGQSVNLSRRSIEDEDGAVLMDFSKIVLDADDSIEPQTVTAEMEALEALDEDTIPRFNITAENGKSGDSGSSGSNGITGTYGESGKAGANGGAGTSGTNGAGGSAGSSGSDGDKGSSETVSGTVLSFPVFTIENWKITATGCSGSISVSNSLMLDRAASKTSLICLVDMATGATVPTNAQFDESPVFTESGSYTFTYSNLEPDHCYRLVVSATINTGLTGAQDYLRDFISKTFWTDSVGIFLAQGNATVNSTGITVTKQDYAPADLTRADVYLYTSLDGANTATASAPDTSTKFAGPMTVSLAGKDSGTCNFTGLSSNTTYFVRLVAYVGADRIMPAQTLVITTPKATATVGAPSLTANRGSWGFDVASGAVYDPDGGITGWAYEFFAETSVTSAGGSLSVKTDASGNEYPAAKTVSYTGSGTVTVPVDGSTLLLGTGYYVRTVAYFYDNQTTVSITSPLSNRAQLDGGQLPSLYFANNDGVNTDLPTTATSLSGRYDALWGWLVVAPGSTSSQLLVDNSHHPVVTIRAAGYYYTNCPVYLDSDPAKPSDGAYLTAVNDGGYIYIAFPETNTASATTGTTGVGNTVYGLRANTQYQIILTGDLSVDGVNAYALNARVGSCVVTTPATVPCLTNWNTLSTPQDGHLFDTQVSLKALASASAVDQAAFAHQMDALTSVTLTLTAGSQTAPGETLATLELTQDNFKAKLGSVAKNADTLGELFCEGFMVDNLTFGKAASSFSGLSALCVSLSEARDYTVLSKNRLNQKAYTSLLDDGTPAASVQDGAVYTNEFTLVNAVCEITLSPTPDELPDPGKGITITAQDTDDDGVKNDAYQISANYLNSGKLAKTITFYVFDNPDFSQDYTDTTKWQLNPAFSDSDAVPMIGATVVAADGSTPYLGSVTVSVPSSGVMPTVNFIPMTCQAYYNDLYGENTTAAQTAVSSYVAGQSTDSRGHYLFFLNESHASEPRTGHQFLFAWTMTYQLTNSPALKYYPFDTYPTLTYPNSLPTSAVQDSPRATPIIYALPEGSSPDSVTWGVYVYDPEDALASGELYERSGLTSGRDTGASVLSHTADLTATELSAFFTAADTVTIPTTADGSHPIALRVQWYTDKYTQGGSGIYAGSTYMGYLPSTISNSQKSVLPAGGSKTIAVYLNAFTYYSDRDAYRTALSTDTVSVTLKEVRTDPSNPASNINRYLVTLTGPQSILQTANALRLTFTNGKGTVSVDKALEGTDKPNYTQEDTGCTAQFYVSLSRELSAIAGQYNTAVTAALLFETGCEGFGDLSDVSLHTYAITADNNLGYVLSDSGWYAFNSISVLQNHRILDEYTLPRFGSFFNLSNCLMSGNVLSADIASTRNNALFELLQRGSFDIASALGAYSGNLAVVPRTLSASAISDIMLTDFDDNVLNAGDFRIPAITPVIRYSNKDATSNSISADYAVEGLPAGAQVYFLISEDSTYTLDPAKLFSFPLGNNHFEFTELYPTAAGDDPARLKAEVTYRVTAFYYDADTGTYKELNELDSSGNELPNACLLKTSAEPTVTFSAYYSASGYTAKNLTVNFQIEDVINYYTVLELYDSDGSFLTYLDAEEGSKNVFCFSNGGTAQHSGSGTIYKGDVFRAVAFNKTGTHKPITSSEKIFLSYGNTYTVRLRVYPIGYGPAYTKDGTDLIASVGGIARATKTFTVTDGADDANLSGTYALIDNGTTLVPTVSFTPVFTRVSATTRQMKYAVVITRSRLVNESYQVSDVTDAVCCGAQPAGTLVTECGSFSTRDALILSDDSGSDLFRDGDVFTCYLYGIQDSLTETTTEGVSPVTRSEILSGRSVEANNLTVESIPVTMGTSELMATCSVEYQGTDTSAGTVTVTRAGNGFYVTMENPVNLSSLTHISWSVTANYDLNGTTDSVTVTKLYEPISAEAVNASIYRILLSPDFHDVPNDAVISSYTVTLQFYTARYDASGTLTYYDSSHISMAAGSNAAIRLADGGFRLTSVVVVDSGTSLSLTAVADAPSAAQAQPESAREALPAETQADSDKSADRDTDITPTASGGGGDDGTGTDVSAET